MNRRKLIGTITVRSAGGYQAACSHCTWRLNKRKKDDAESLLRSHARIAHPVTIRVFAEVPK